MTDQAAFIDRSNVGVAHPRANAFPVISHAAQKEPSNPWITFALVAVGTFGKGKALAYMSDPAPHWGCNFVCWQHYSAFWLKCLDAIL